MINFSQSYFGKDLNKLIYSDIENYFIEEKEESDKIEFKSYSLGHGTIKDSLKGIKRGICAFLNSNGGLLIWGAPKESKTIEGRKVCKGELSPINELIEKDKLISSISDSITPLPVNINVYPIENDGLYLYIFENQQSIYSPHQYNNTYYARLDGQTKPAPHYLIDALFKKVTYPNIEGYINIDGYQPISPSDEINIYKDVNFSGYIDISILLINRSELQNEHNVSYRLVCGQGIFGSFIKGNKEDYDSSGHIYINKGHIDTLSFGGHELDNQRIYFSRDYLEEKHNYKMDLLLSFVGKKSPMKTSMYQLNFGIGSIPVNNPKQLFFKIEENILNSEAQRKKGATVDSFLKDFLIR